MNPEKQSLTTLSISHHFDPAQLFQLLKNALFLHDVQAQKILDELVKEDKIDWNVQQMEGTNQGTTLLFLLLLAVSEQSIQAINLLPKIAGKKELNWNIVITGADEGATPLLELIVNVYNNQPAAISTLITIIEHHDLNWNAAVSVDHSMAKGASALSFLIAALHNDVAIPADVLEKVLPQENLNWNTPIQQAGAGNGATPFYLLMTALCCNKLPASFPFWSILEKAQLDWNSPLLGEGRDQGTTPLFWFMHALSQNQPIAVASLPQIFTQTHLDWNLPCTGEGDFEGQTPLYCFMRAVANGNLAAIAVLPELMKKNLNWNTLAKGGEEKGKTPLYLLMDALFNRYPISTAGFKKQIMCQELAWDQPVEAEGFFTGETPFFLLMYAIWRGNQTALEILPYVIQRKVNWNTPATGSGNTQGKTPLYLLMSAISQGKLIDYKILSKIMDNHELNWNAPITAQTNQKGRTPLHCFMNAILKTKPTAGMLFDKIIKFKDLNWNTPIQGEGAEKGATPFFIYMGAVCRERPTALSHLEDVITNYNLNWNLPLNAAGPHQGVTPFYLLMKAVFVDNPAASSALSKVVANAEVNWNAQVTGTGRDKGKTPLFWLSKALYYAKPAALKLLAQIKTRTDLDWFLNLDLPLSAPLASPFYWLLAAAACHSLSWDVVVELMMNVPLEQVDLEHLPTTPTAAPQLWVSLIKTRLALKTKPYEALSEKVVFITELAEKVIEAGYEDAYLLMIEFFVDCNDEKNALAWFGKIPANHASFAAANFALLKHYQQKGDLNAGDLYAKNIPSHSSYFPQARLVVAQLRMQQMTQSINELNPEHKQQTIKTQAIQLLEATGGSQANEIIEIRKTGILLYLYGERSLPSAHQDEEKLINLIARSNSTTAKVLLARYETAQQYRQKKFKA